MRRSVEQDGMLHYLAPWTTFPGDAAELLAAGVEATEAGKRRAMGEWCLVAVRAWARRWGSGDGRRAGVSC